MAAVNLMCARVNKLNQNQLNANCQKIKSKIEINLQLNALAFVWSVYILLYMVYIMVFMPKSIIRQTRRTHKSRSHSICVVAIK